MKTAIYLRKSRADEQNAENTLAKHKETLLEFAAKNNLTVTKIYEEVVSGESIFNRPEMLKLLSELENYDAVLCMDIDRLGRGDMQEQGLMMNKFRYTDTKIITPREVYNPGNEKDEMFFEFKGIIARNELKAIKRRMGEGRKRTIEQGGYIAEPPYGYIRAWDGKIPTLSPHPEQAEVVRMIFDMYVNQNMGTYSIANHLNQMGLSGRKGTGFSRNTVRFILQNKTYIGLIQWNRNKHIRKKSPDEKNRRQIMPEKDWIVVKGKHPAIVDEDIFWKADKIRRSHSHPPSNNGTVKNPFCGLLYCGVCGSLMTRQYSKKHNWQRVICTTKGCTKSATVEQVEKQFYRDIDNFVKKCESGLVDFGIDKGQTESTENAIEKLEKKLTVTIGQKNKLHDLLEQGVYDIPTFMERKETIEREIEAIEKSIEEQKEILNELNQKLTNEDFIPNAKKLLKNYWGSNPEEKNIMLKSIVSYASYERKKGEWNNDFFLDIHFKLHK